MITVEEIMSVSVQTLNPKNSLTEAKKLMAENGIHHVPIVDDAGKVVGLVSHRDTLAASESCLKKGDTTLNADEIAIEEFMTTGVTTVDGRAGLREAALFLQKHQYGCLPVVTDGKLKGIITDSDFVAVAIDLLEQAEQIEPEDF
jgi:CBS domain-containing membrane protein